MNNQFTYPENCRLIQGISNEGFQHLCACMGAREVHLKSKEVLIHESDPVDKIGIVVKGAVCISRTVVDGHRVVLETVTAPETFGTTYVFSGVKMNGADITAVGEATVILLGTAHLINPCPRICDDHLQYLKNLLFIICHRNYQLKQKLRIVSQKTIRGKLMMFLYIRSRRAKSMEFDIPYARQALADFLCVDRSALSAEISKLRDEGILESHKNHFKILRHH